MTIEPVDDRNDGTAIRLVWKGRSSARNPGELLVPYFQGVFDWAVRSGRVTVEMHFERMEHFNSSTVGALIYLIQDARGRQVPMVFVYDQKLKWQKLSFDAMRVFVKSDGLLQMRSV
ncbi:MAG TPA: hypothetical protein VN914_18740 [Polyangia bacterium]|nr:hypothetical protein [Polyangia bacterium]